MTAALVWSPPLAVNADPHHTLRRAKLPGPPDRGPRTWASPRTRRGAGHRRSAYEGVRHVCRRSGRGPLAAYTCGRRRLNRMVDRHDPIRARVRGVLHACELRDGVDAVGRCRRILQRAAAGPPRADCGAPLVQCVLAAAMFGGRRVALSLGASALAGWCLLSDRASVR
jgi:hypothetical protein